MDAEVSNVEVKLRLLEEAGAERERRLKELTELQQPTRAEFNETLVLSSSLQLLKGQIHRLRAEIALPPAECRVRSLT
jgi:hypothetical protein